jgi:hypothetical protein
VPRNYKQNRQPKFLILIEVLVPLLQLGTFTENLLLEIMKKLILILLISLLCCFGQTAAAFALTRVTTPEMALNTYLEALKAGQLDRAAAVDCWGYTPTKMAGVKSWELKQISDSAWQAAIQFESENPKEAQSNWNFEVAKTTAYRSEMIKILDGSVNLWAKRANKLARAVGIDLKDPTPLKPEDIISVSKEPFCITAHSKIEPKEN